MSNVKWVIRDTIYKEIKNKTLFIVLVINLIILLASSFGIDFAFDYISDGTEIDFNNEKINIFLFFINFWTSVLCLLLFGTSSIRSDEEAGILGQILTLPIKEESISLGVGSVPPFLVVGFYLLLMTLSTVIFSISEKVSLGVWLPVGLFGNFGFIACLILITMGIGLFFNKLIAFLVSIVFYVFLQALSLNVS